MTSTLEMQVRLYLSPDELATGKPVWTGSLDEFWSRNQHGYTWGEMRVLADELTSTGFHRGGGGAAPVFWLVRGEAAAPKGWDVAETSVEVDATIRDLVAALEAMLAHYDMHGVRDWTPNKATIDARAALARAKHGRG
jgi:hypothetical protein